MNETQEIKVTLESGSSISVPSSWIIEKLSNHILLTSPEKDISIYLLESPLEGSVSQNPGEILSNSWKTIDPGFHLKTHFEGSQPTTENWEKSYIAVYDVPASESRTVVAGVQIFDNRAYIALIDATQAGFSRRGADLGVILGSWKPKDFQEVSLTQQQVHHWTEEEVREFETFVTDSMKALQIPGVAISIVKQDGSTFYSNGFGVKQIGRVEPVDLDTPFMIGSTTKALTTAMMAKLIDQGKLTWETPIIDVLKNFKVSDPEFTNKLTFRHSVSASTGMPRRDLEFIFKYKGISAEDRLAQMKDIVI